jgi:hypothetical protein
MTRQFYALVRIVGTGTITALRTSAVFATFLARSNASRGVEGLAL